MKQQKVTMAERAIREMRQAKTVDDFTYHLCAYLALLAALEQLHLPKHKRIADHDASV